jgi:hypothetical protein
MNEFIIRPSGGVQISVLVPFGATPDAAGAHRAAVWAYCRRKWQGLVDARVVDELVVGHDPLFGKRQGFFREEPSGLEDWPKHPRPFSVARALNNAAKHAHGEHLLLFGADHVPDVKAVEWAVHQLRGYAFARIYGRVAYATEAATRIVLSNLHYPLDAADWHEHSAPCPGVLAVRRSAWDKAGGLDERYEGWGYEDTAFLDKLVAVHQNGLRGRLEPSGFILRELWHDGAARDLAGRNAALYREGPQS